MTKMVIVDATDWNKVLGRNPATPKVSVGGEYGKKDARLVIDAEGCATFKYNYPPKSVEYSGFENTYNEVERPDRQPLLRRSGRTLRKFTMTLLLLPKEEYGLNNKNVSIDDRLENLKALAQTNNPVFVGYDPQTTHKGTGWSITSLTFTSIERTKQDDYISRAEVTIEFTERPEKTDVTINKTTKKRRKKYTVKKGETLFKIALKFYQTDNIQIVKAIAKVNDIKNYKHVKTGKKLTLP